MSVILIIVASQEKLQDPFLTRFWTTMSSRLVSRAYSSAKIKKFSLVYQIYQLTIHWLSAEMCTFAHR